MAKKFCSLCGQVMEGSASAKCTAGTNHKLARVEYERAEEAERKKKEAKQKGA